MFQSFVISFALLFIAAVSALSNEPYDYGYDNGERGNLGQLLDGLAIQSRIQGHVGDEEVSRLHV